MEIVVIILCLVLGGGWYLSYAAKREILDEKAQLEKALAKERDAAESCQAERNRAAAECEKERRRADTAEAAIAKACQRADAERDRARNAALRAVDAQNEARELRKRNEEQGATIHTLQTQGKSILHRAENEKQRAKQQVTAEKLRADAAGKRLKHAEAELNALQAVVPPNIVKAAMKEVKNQDATPKGHIAADDTVTNTVTGEVFRPAKTRSGKIIGWMNLRTGEVTEKSPFEGGDFQRKMNLSR